MQRPPNGQRPPSRRCSTKRWRANSTAATLIARCRLNSVSKTSAPRRSRPTKNTLVSSCVSAVLGFLACSRELPQASLFSRQEEPELGRCWPQAKRTYSCAQRPPGNVAMRAKLAAPARRPPHPAPRRCRNWAQSAGSMVVGLTIRRTARPTSDAQPSARIQAAECGWPPRRRRSLPVPIAHRIGAR